MTAVMLSIKKVIGIIIQGKIYPNRALAVLSAIHGIKVLFMLFGFLAFSLSFIVLYILFVHIIGLLRWPGSAMQHYKE